MASLFSNKIIRVLIGIFLISLSGCFLNDDGEVVITPSATVDETGGIVEDPTGFTVDFPAGALSDSASVSLSEVALPAALPGNIIAGGRAYKIDGLDGVALNTPVTISFTQTNVDTSLPEGALGIYRWDGVAWSFVGGVLDTQAGTVSTEVSSFSVFILGTGASLHKTITFANADLLHNYVVSPYQYLLAYPLMDSPISSLSVAVFARTGYTARMSLAQGIYTFCMDWDSGEVDENNRIIYNYRFIGNYPDNPAIKITENTNATVPPLISLGVSGSTYVGRCPGPMNMGPTVEAGTGINLGDPEVTLTWNNDSDLDLWVVEPSGVNVGFSNRGPVADTAQLDVDDVCDADIMIGGPEHIYWSGQSNLLNGRYEVWVNHFEKCDTNPDWDSLPRLRLVVGNVVDYFPGTDVGTDIVMRPFNDPTPNGPGPDWCRIWAFERGVWPPLKCGRDFEPCCVTINGAQEVPPTWLLPPLPLP